jgi:hypothetical protein
MKHHHTPTAAQRHQAIEVTELVGQQAEDALVSDFGQLSLAPIEEDRFRAQLRRVFGGSVRDVKRGVA